MDTKVLVRLGAKARLAEIEQEADQLRELLADGQLSTAGNTTRSSTLPRKLHWTQRPENRAKLLATRRKGAKTRAQHERA